jgi:hypothetical protein
MGRRRIQYGGLSFIPPMGFEVLEEASRFATRNGEDQDTGVPGTPITVTLIDRTAHPDVPDYSESAHDMNPAAYPASLTLSIKEQGDPPLVILRNMERVMKSYFEGYRIHFFQNERIGNHTAARSQSAYKSHFQIFRLNYAWHTNRRLAIACLTVTSSGVRAGWGSLRAFAISVRLS